MTATYFTSDLHLGHKNICNFRTEFSSVEEHFNVVKENYHKVVRKNDKVYLLGDIAFNKDMLEEVKTWYGEKVLICGNHDLEKGITMKDLCNVYSEIYSFRRYKDFWLTHCPMHQDELYNRICVHGHTHSKQIDDPRYINICLEHTEYKPLSLEQLRKKASL